MTFGTSETHVINCIDAIDGKHVKVLASPNSVSKFLNYKHSFSIVLLALVDVRYKFTVVDIGSYGRNSDGGIFAYSKLGKYLEIRLDIPEDNSFPEHHDYPLMLLLTYLMGHYPGSQSKGDNEKSFLSYLL
jgi:hypothetical protein